MDTLKSRKQQKRLVMEFKGKSKILMLALPGGPTDRLSVPFPHFVSEDGSRIQLPKRYSLVIL